ncbi:hypothetical protein OG923_34600 (plasmid) [Streptomyces halstedii]|uniref:hypothetical protein n=1 Tax=Streptomyces halstedii TaxID=1944 RepID=UPI002F913A1E
MDALAGPPAVPAPAPSAQGPAGGAGPDDVMSASPTPVADRAPAPAPSAQGPAGGAGPDDVMSASPTPVADRAPAGAPGAEPASVPSTGAGEPTGGGVAAGPSADVVRRAREAAEVLRGQLKRPGGFHRARAAGIAVRLMGVELGGAQERALEVWGEVYGKTSGTLHGAGADPAPAAARPRRPRPSAGRARGPRRDGGDRAGRLGGPARHVVLLPFRPGPGLARRAGRVRRDLLLADEASGAWPAAPFLEHLAATAPATARPWLAARAGQVAAGGPGALDALLRLALAGALAPAGVRSLLPYVTAPPRPGAPSGQGGFARRLAACWARTLTAGARDGDWLVVAEELLTDAVDAEHAGHLALQAVLERAHAAQDAAEACPAPGPGAARAAARADLELEEAIARQGADRLPGHDVGGLLRELTATVHAGGGPFRWARAVRGAVAGLLRRDVEAIAPAARHLVSSTSTSTRSASATPRPCWPWKAGISPRPCRAAPARAAGAARRAAVPSPRPNAADGPRHPRPGPAPCFAYGP